jgi:hypothetical protein
MKSVNSNDSVYEGFLMDLLEELSRDVGFQFVVEENTKYGSLDAESGNWTGMIGKLVNKVTQIDKRSKRQKERRRKR